MSLISDTLQEEVADYKPNLLIFIWYFRLTIAGTGPVNRQ